jgi:probable addiction module antidote protein
MNRKSRPYEVGLHERLKNLNHAVNYIKAAAEDSREAFLLALRDVAEATKGMTKVAEISDKNRENLYRMLSEDGNPRLDSLWAVVQAMALRLTVESAGLDLENAPASGAGKATKTYDAPAIYAPFAGAPGAGNFSGTFMFLGEQAMVNSSNQYVNAVPPGPGPLLSVVINISNNNQPSGGAMMETSCRSIDGGIFIRRLTGYTH